MYIYTYKIASNVARMDWPDEKTPKDLQLRII